MKGWKLKLVEHLFLSLVALNGVILSFYEAFHSNYDKATFIYVVAWTLRVIIVEEQQAIKTKIFGEGE